ncbi:phosphoserine phosphatase [Tieghemostelium lacteum]|uniref:phosphoserine phosphatase n=1 Tax=Tieghemostelium lacteum TaxID=361077 RepID=A0A151ZEH1_TIELA|nr:phosphoserine phosphatase [Tieghemostelium lacteum]|eukprot:KYQ92327.1 phosphoserine phosphatase [Tieghemostelium lacteum]
MERFTIIVVTHSPRENDSSDFFKVLKISFESKYEYSEIGKELLNKNDSFRVNNNVIYEYYFHTEKHFSGSKRYLAAFDMDSCLIKNECIDEMADIMQVGKQVSDITALAMAGQLDFNQALEKRLSLLSGMTRDQLDIVWSRIQLNAGTFTLIRVLKSLGYKTALISGGFTYFSRKIAAALNIDYTVANTLEFNEDGTLTGRVIGPIINAQMKKLIVEQIAIQNEWDASHCITMGDGSNDKLMIEYAHFGVAYHAKPILKSATPFHINSYPTSTLCFFLPELLELLNTNESESTLLGNYLMNRTYLFDLSLHDLEIDSNLFESYKESEVKILNEIKKRISLN